MTRIIAGEWRGRRLATPVGDDTRPTADRTRETLFSMLVSRLGGLNGLAVADLFAGSGALGLEALSRGAASCLFVDRSAPAVVAIHANIAALNAVNATVHRGSADSIAPPPTPFDVILLDPPYTYTDLNELMTVLTRDSWIGAGGIVALETRFDTVVSVNDVSLIAHRCVGKAALHLFRRTEPGRLSA